MTLRRVATSLGVQRFNFDIAFALVFLFVLHGISTVKIVGLLTVNFYISRIEDRRVALALTWVFGIACLFANELLEGYPLAILSPSLGWIDAQFGGLMPRWDVHFKFTMLRMVSFNVDYLRALEAPPSPRATSKPSDALVEKQRIENSHALKDYNFRNYMAYALYSPFYIAGPVVSFNDWFVQSRHKLPSVNRQRITAYAVRFGLCLLTMELVLHYIYVVSICETRAWKNDTPFQISMVALMNLNVIWLKLLLPWRLFRLWGLLDGIDAPENMVRCVNNNYSTLSFWRSWHRSYNRWVTRYVYIPLGGSQRPIVNSLIVFTFVAIWHDIQLRLLIWGWMVVFFVLPEVTAGLIFPRKVWGSHKIYRHLCAVGGVANIWMMMIANLVGFAVGVDGIRQMLHDMVTTADGLKYVIIASCTLFIGVQAMFEFREREHRKGIDLRC